MLSIFLTEELETITSNMENTELIFYFCVHDDDDRNSATKILRGLVYQILEKQPDLTKHALQYLETAEKTQQTMSSPEALWIIFRKIVLDVNFCKTFCVIDGLDECDAYTKKMLVPKIVDLFKHPTLAEIAFKLVIVSRDIPGLKGCTTVKLDPDNDNMVGRDVEQFIFDSVKDLSRIERADEAFLADVRNTLLERSSGSFLWVGFVMLELSEQTTRNEVQHTLRTIPQDLSSIYKRIVGQIKEIHRPTSSLILGWVTTAARPLTLQELGAAIGIRRSASIAVEEVIRDHVTHCGPLLTVRKQEVTLVHESAKEYLLRNNSDSDATQGEIRINERGAHLKALQACLDCIEHSLLDAAPLVYDDDFFSKQAPLLKYAVLHWPEHAKRSSELAKNVFSKSKAFFRKKSDLRDQWQRIYWIFGLSIKNPAKMPLLHLASYFGIVTWVELLVDKKAFLSRFRNLTHKKDNDGRTALMYAAIEGHEPVVRLLLLEGHADADAKDNNGSTALMQAAIQGHEPARGSRGCCCSRVASRRRRREGQQRINGADACRIPGPRAGRAAAAARGSRRRRREGQQRMDGADVCRSPGPRAGRAAAAARGSRRRRRREGQQRMDGADVCRSPGPRAGRAAAGFKCSSSSSFILS